MNYIKFNKIIKYTLYGIGACVTILSLLPSCKKEKQQNEKQQKEEPKIEREIYGTSHSIEIVKVRNCEYVFYDKGYGYGLDMEHYEGCENSNHYK